MEDVGGGGRRSWGGRMDWRLQLARAVQVITAADESFKRARSPNGSICAPLELPIFPGLTWRDAQAPICTPVTSAAYFEGLPKHRWGRVTSAAPAFLVHSRRRSPHLTNSLLQNSCS